MTRTLIAGVFASALAWPQDRTAADLKALYDARDWTELSAALGRSKGTDLYRGAVAVVFHQNPLRAESLLHSAIKRAPKSNEAYEAYEWLSHLYLYSGQYRLLLSAMEARWAAFPEKADKEGEKAALAGLRGLPDQVTERVRPSIVHHEDNSVFVPVTVNSHTAAYFFDTGGWVSSVSESEAKRIGLRFTENKGTTATMTNTAAFRTAVADELMVGDVRLRNVSFAVFPDNNEPWSNLAPGRQGLLGIPIIIAFRTLRWARDGTLKIGEKPSVLDMRKTNLIFDNDHLVVAADIRGRKVFATVDTGAQTTDLYGEFAKDFPALTEAGKKGSSEVRGIGGAESYASVTLHDLAIDVGGLPVVLRPVHILLNRFQLSYIGNFGMDLWQQGRAFKLDFTAMTLQLERSE